MPAEITDNTIKAFCEIAPSGKRIDVYFHSHQEVDDVNHMVRRLNGEEFPAKITTKDAVQRIPGAKFSGYEPVTPYWSVPLTLEAARELRQIFGKGLELGDGVRSWGRIEVRTERTLHSLVVANDAKLKVLPKRYPKIAKLINGSPVPGYPKSHPFGQRRPDRSYQRADIAMMAQANCLNANQPGTGKSLECLGAIVEGGYIDGPNLISAPIRSLENVWRKEIETWLPGIPVFTSEDATKRKLAVAEGLELAREGKPCFVLVNSAMLRVTKWKSKIDPDTGKQMEKPPTTAKEGLALKTHETKKADANGEDVVKNVYVWGNDLMREICEVDWQTFTIDEFHQEGLNNPLALFTLGSGLVKAERQWRMSGTPMGGKPINLYPVLRSIEPDKFSNKWDWINKWLDSSNNGFGTSVTNIKEGLEEEFYNAHSRHMVRRLKREALPGIPAKQIVEVTCKMTQNQKAQYIAFENDAEIEIQSKISGGDPVGVVGTCILAQFTRLKQFANAYCVANEKSEIVPTEESGKLPYLEEKLDEFGIRRLMPEPDVRAIISSESKRMARMVSEWLTAKGIANGLLTGDTKAADSQKMIDWFQNGHDGLPFVLVMSTQTGGVSLNLERAGSVHILDEMYNPDRQEQLEDRGDRGTRVTPLVCVYYRTEETIQQYIAELCAGKKVTNTNVLDVYRRMRREKGFGGAL